ncbi:unnamed protein product [Kuraishia capsulata CBS 1993]|uniref:Uncharacterized protein n=1 Tax=Kuraishia capsulata CBS 1993 TaxID=1382522 RepID=W6MQJ9_9ASCO|nr:uncharacterized protein KUCA_T00004592001 [Kuraishia capsulata CBS 1993]CDK28608.1 unnamed protein product [Kuraishia capsulata CBS 1993]
MFPTAHCQVRAAKIDSNSGRNLLARVREHNYVNKVDLLAPKTSQGAVQSLPLSKMVCYKVRTKLQTFISRKFLDGLCQEDLLDGLTVVSLSSIQYEDSFSVHSGTLYVTLCSESYYKLGLNGEQSKAFSDKKRAKMFRLQFKLSEFLKKDKEVPHDHLKFLWFAEKIYDRDIELVVSLRSQSEILTKTFEKVIPATLTEAHTDLVNLCHPDLLSPLQDESWAEETLEWITYASIHGKQLYHPEDPYLSSYRLSGNFVEDSTVDVSITSWSGALFPKGLVSDNVVRQVVEGSYPWAALVIYGVKDANTAYKSVEHVYYENGENVFVLLKSGEWIVVWEIFGGGDSV